MACHLPIPICTLHNIKMISCSTGPSLLICCYFSTEQSGQPFKRSNHIPMLFNLLISVFILKDYGTLDSCTCLDKHNISNTIKNCAKANFFSLALVAKISKTVWMGIRAWEGLKIIDPQRTVVSNDTLRAGVEVAVYKQIQTAFFLG